MSSVLKYICIAFSSWFRYVCITLCMHHLSKSSDVISSSKVTETSPTSCSFSLLFIIVWHNFTYFYNLNYKCYKCNYIRQCYIFSFLLSNNLENLRREETLIVFVHLFPYCILSLFLMFWVPSFSVSFLFRELLLAICYVWMSVISQNSYIEILMPQVMVLGGEAFGRWLGCRVGSLWMRSMPYERECRDLLCPWTMWKHEKWAVCHQEGFHRTNHADPQISDSFSPELPPDFGDSWQLPEPFPQGRSTGNKFSQLSFTWKVS